MVTLWFVVCFVLPWHRIPRGPLRQRGDGLITCGSFVLYAPP